MYIVYIYVYCKWEIQQTAKDKYHMILQTPPTQELRGATQLESQVPLPPLPFEEGVEHQGDTKYSSPTRPGDIENNVKYNKCEAIFTTIWLYSYYPPYNSALI